ncbi:hypothetical protein [Pseudonocardia sp. GCM10023141]|uniref:hypothetical protein n=1 Tax=Pseudonocardia sp. GCM10023141 TaxID=3252653 RepID=UPI00361744E3
MTNTEGPIMTVLSDIEAVPHIDDATVGRNESGEPTAAAAGPPPRCVVTPPDRAGRIADRSLCRHMGWNQQTGIRFEVRGRFVIVTADGSAPAITTQGHLRVPLAIRRRCRIDAGTRLLIVAWRENGTVVICTASAVEEMLRTLSAGAGTGFRGRR